MAFGLSNSNDLVRPWSTQLGPAVSAGSLVHPVRVPIVTFLAEHGQEISATDPTLLPWQKVGVLTVAFCWRSGFLLQLFG